MAKTIIHYANPNGEKALEIQHANGVAEIEKALTDQNVHLIGYRGEKKDGDMVHTFSAPHPIEPEVQTQIKRLQGVQRILAL